MGGQLGAVAPVGPRLVEADRLEAGSLERLHLAGELGRRHPQPREAAVALGAWMTWYIRIGMRRVPGSTGAEGRNCGEAGALIDGRT